MKFRASLESVKTRKNVTDDVVQVAVFSVWCKPDEIGELNKLYRQPLELDIRIIE